MNPSRLRRALTLSALLLASPLFAIDAPVEIGPSELPAPLSVGAVPAIPASLEAPQISVAGPEIPSISGAVSPTASPAASAAIIPALPEPAAVSYSADPDVHPAPATASAQMAAPADDGTIPQRASPDHPALQSAQRASRAAIAGDAASTLGEVMDGARAADAPAVALDEAAQTDPAAEFAAAYPGYSGAELLSPLRISFNDFAADVVFKNIFMQIKDGEPAVDMIVPKGIPGRAGYVDLVRRIIALADRNDAGGRRFAAVLARRKAAQNLPSAFMTAQMEPLPANPLKRGEYWDLAAGPNGQNHMAGRLDPNTRYVFIDRSNFVTAYLQESRTLLASRGRDMSHVRVVQADLRQLPTPTEPLSVVRWKNVHTYVQGFERQLLTFSKWLAPGGQLILQNDPGPQRLATISKLGPSIQDLISDGWAFDFEPLDQGGLETATLTKPAANASPSELREARRRSQQRWKAYEQAVQETMSDPRALLRRMFGI